MKKARIFSNVPITPLNIFLTPELKPFYGGIYFPSVTQSGMLSWNDLLKLISAAWNDPSKKKKVPLWVSNYQGL